LVGDGFSLNVALALALALISAHRKKSKSRSKSKSKRKTRWGTVALGLQGRPQGFVVQAQPGGMRRKGVGWGRGGAAVGHLAGVQAAHQVAQRRQRGGVVVHRGLAAAGARGRAR